MVFLGFRKKALSTEGSQCTQVTTSSVHGCVFTRNRGPPRLPPSRAPRTPGSEPAASTPEAPVTATEGLGAYKASEVNPAQALHGSRRVVLTVFPTEPLSLPSQARDPQVGPRWLRLSSCVHLWAPRALHGLAHGGPLSPAVKRQGGRGAERGVVVSLVVSASDPPPSPIQTVSAKGVTSPTQARHSASTQSHFRGDLARRTLSSPRSGAPRRKSPPAPGQTRRSQARAAWGWDWTAAASCGPALCVWQPAPSQSPVAASRGSLS